MVVSALRQIYILTVSPMRVRVVAAKNMLERQTDART